MSTHNSPGLTQFELGELIHPKQRVRPADHASGWEKMQYEWPDWCQRMKKVLAADKGTFYVPPLLRHWKDEERQVEYFDIGLPGAFDAMQPRVEIPQFLASSKGAAAHVTLMAPKAAVEPLLRERGFGDMPVLRVVLSYFTLPEMELFDHAKIPSSADRFYLGLLSEGSDLIWDTSVDIPHGLFVGKTRSGKSETVASIAAQAWKKGWRVIIISPTTGDPTFQKFAELCPEDVVLGSTDEDYERALGIWKSLDEEMHGRELENSEQGVNTWGRPVDGYTWRGRKTLIVTDECGDFFEPDKHVDSDVALVCKQAIRALHAKIAAKGAKVRYHLIDMTQNPNVDAVGGGKALRNMGLVVAVKALATTWFPVVFEGSQSTHLMDVLASPGTKQGRAIARGAMPPENEFGGVVDDTPVQLAYFEQDARDAWLDEGRDEGDDEDGPVLAVVEDDGEPWVEPTPWVEPETDPVPDRVRMELVPDQLAAEAFALDPGATPAHLVERQQVEIVRGEPAPDGLPHMPPPPDGEIAAPIEAPAEWTESTDKEMTRWQARLVIGCAAMFAAYLAVGIYTGIGLLIWLSIGGFAADLAAYCWYRPKQPKSDGMPTPKREVTPGLIIAPAAAVVFFLFAAIAFTTL